MMMHPSGKEADEEEVEAGGIGVVADKEAFVEREFGVHR
jgi:hypothetical protein